MTALKRFIFLFAFSFLFIGCTTVFTSISIPDLNGEKVAGTGDLFFVHKEGAGFEGGTEPFLRDAFSFDLTILELNDSKIGLQYTEYTKVVEPTGNAYAPTRTSDWLVKQGYNKRFDYDIADKVIRFKGYEFEIVSIDKGYIRYKRIK